MTQPPSGPGPQGPDYGQQPGPYQGQPGQYPPGYGQPPQKKSKKKWVIGCLGLIGLAIVLFAGCGALLVGAEDATDTDTTPGTVSTGTSAPAEEEDETEPSAVQTEEVTDAGTITLEATATTTGTVIWGDLDGSTNTEQFTGTWTKEIDRVRVDEVLEGREPFDEATMSTDHRFDNDADGPVDSVERSSALETDAAVSAPTAR